MIPENQQFNFEKNKGMVSGTQSKESSFVNGRGQQQQYLADPLNPGKLLKLKMLDFKVIFYHKIDIQRFKNKEMSLEHILQSEIVKLQSSI